MIASLTHRFPLVASLSYLFTGTLLARLFSAATVILIARQSGPANFGQYTATFTLAWLSSPLFSLGLDNWLLGYGRRSGHDSELAAHATTVLFLKFCLGLIWFGVMVSTALILDADVFPPRLLLLAALCVWADEMGRVAWAAFQCAQRNRSTLLLMILSQGSVFASIGLLYGTGERDVYRYALIQTVATGAGSLFAIFWQVRHFEFRLESQRLLPMLRATVAFGLSVALSNVYGRVDIALVAFLLGQAEAGLYGPAVSLITALGLIPLVIYNVYLPILSQTYVEEKQRFWPLLHQALRMSLLVGGILGGATALLSRMLVHSLYGPAYGPTVTILAILTGVLFARSISLSAAAGMIALHRQGQRVYLQLIAAVFNVAANLFVIPRWGISGAAMVFVLTEGGLSIGYLGTLWRAYRSKMWSRLRDGQNAS